MPPTFFPARLPRPVDRHFDGFLVGGDLGRVRVDGDGQCEALACNTHNDVTSYKHDNWQNIILFGLPIKAVTPLNCSLGVEVLEQCERLLPLSKHLLPSIVSPENVNI